MKKTGFIAGLLCLSFVIAAPLSAVAAKEPAVKVNGDYSPFWTKKWVDASNGGLYMWSGYYIDQGNKTLKTDLIEKGGGEWAIPGDPYASVWEGQNAIQPTAQSDVGYIFTSPESMELEFDFSAVARDKQSTGILFTIYKNDFNTKIYPTDKPNLLLVGMDEIKAKFRITVNKDDKLFFNFNSGEDEFFDLFYLKRFALIVKSINDPAASTTNSAATETTTSGVASGTTSSRSGTPDSTAKTPDGTESKPAETTSNGGGIVIDPGIDTPAIAPKFEDVEVDLENNTITLNKKITVSEFLESFTLKDGHTIQLFNKDASAVEDTAAVMADGMVLRLYNQETPVNALRIIVKFVVEEEKVDTPNEGFPVIPVVIIAIVVVIAAGAAVFIILRKKKQQGLKEED